MIYDVFISYETDSGKDYAEHLKHALEKSKNPKFNVFVAHINLTSGDDWRKEIDIALEKSHFFIVIITALTNESEEVKREYKKALKLNKRIISLRHTRMPLSETEELSKLQQLEFKNDSELANETIFALRDILRKEKENIKIENDSEEFVNRGNLFFNLMQYGNALDSYDKAIELKSDFIDAWNNKGMALFELKCYKEAIGAYNKALEIDSEIAEIWSNKGVIYSEINNFEEALKSYNEAIRLDPNLSTAWSNRGALFKKFYNLPKALEDYIVAIELDSTNATALSNIGVILETMGFLEESLLLHIKATKLDPYYPLAWYNKGLIMAKIGYPAKESLDAYDNALKLNYNHQDVWFNRGVALKELMCFKDALKSFNNTIKLNPNHVRAWNNKGVMLLNLNRPDEALEAFNNAIELKPLILSLYYKFIILIILDRINEAFKIAKIAVIMEPRSSEEFYAIASLNAFLRNKEKALENLSKAIDSDTKFKEYSKRDRYFKNFWDDEAFKKLVE